MNISEAEEKQNQLLYHENAANRVKRNGKMIFPLISFTRLVHYNRRRDERNKKGCSEVGVCHYQLTRTRSGCSGTVDTMILDICN